MAKKLNANIFVYSANDLINGHVVFYSGNKGWVNEFTEAKKIMKEDIDHFEKKIASKVKKNLVVNPYLVELNDDGTIKKLREKIRFTGLNLKGFENV